MTDAKRHPAAAGTWIGVRQGIVVLVAGGILIFPLMKAVLWLAGRRTSVGEDDPLNGLAGVPLAGGPGLGLATESFAAGGWLEGGSPATFAVRAGFRRGRR